jgi:putative ABC transport system permease protein
MKFALLTLWFERRRYFPGVLAVAFSTVLIALQIAIMLGLVSLVSLPVDLSSADVWIASHNTPSCDLGLPISRKWTDRLAMQPEVVATDEFFQNFTFWKDPTQGNVLVMLLGCNVTTGSLGPVGHLSPAQCVLLSEPGAVLLDASDCGRLGIDRIGQTGEVYGQRVRVVGFTRGMGSITGPYVLCSLQTARQLLGAFEYGSDYTTYALARCADPAQAAAVARRFGDSHEISAFAGEEFSWKTRRYWLVTTKVGVAVGFVALLGLLVGTLVTSQTLYAATLVSMKELALLRALGAPRWRLALYVLEQSLLVGLIGLGLGLGLTAALARLAATLGTNAFLPSWLLIGTTAVVLGMALLSGLFALRSLRHIEPGQLLR